MQFMQCKFAYFLRQKHKFQRHLAMSLKTRYDNYQNDKRREIINFNFGK